MNWIDNAEIKTAEDKAKEAKEQERQAAKAKRDAAINNITYPIGDRAIQCRPKDEQLVRGAIRIMERHGVTEYDDWIAADNQEITVTKAQFEAALIHGDNEVARIFKEYSEALKQ